MANIDNISSKKPANIKKKATIAILLAVVAVGMTIGTYFWQKGRFESGADVEQAAKNDEESVEFVTRPSIVRSNWEVGGKRGSFVSIRNGTLVKMENDPTVYLIYKGTKRPIASPSAFERFKFKWENILVLPVVQDEYFGLYETGEKIAEFDPKNLPNGYTFNLQGNPTVYSIVEGKMRPYPSPSVFLTHHKWSEISFLGRENIEMTKNQIPFRYRDGVLVRPDGQATVYWVVGGYKMHIESVAAFEAYDLKWSNIIVAEETEIAGATVLDAQNPVYPNKKMYQDGYTLGFPVSDLIGQTWKNSDNPTVFFNAFYTTEYEKLTFTCPQVYQNRFSWNELIVF